MSRLSKREKFVKEKVKNSKKNTSEVVSKLSKKLFVSERTIWRDLSK